MKKITLPVSRLTRAVMLNRYGAEPITLASNDVRRRQLMNMGAPDRHLERKQYSLNTSITLLVNRHEYDHLSNRRAEIGFLLYAIDKADIFKFVWARVSAGLPALHAIYDYYAAHGIEEDDHAIDTAERQWKRWRKEKEKERHTNTPEYVPRLCDVLLSERQAEDVVIRIDRFIEEVAVQIDPRYRYGLRCFVLCYLTPMTVREVAAQMKKRRSDVGKSARRFREYLQYNQELRIVVGYCLKTTEAQPTPSAAS